MPPEAEHDSGSKGSSPEKAQGERFSSRFSVSEMIEIDENFQVLTDFATLMDVPKSQKRSSLTRSPPAWMSKRSQKASRKEHSFSSAENRYARHAAFMAEAKNREKHRWTGLPPSWQIKKTAEKVAKVLKGWAFTQPFSTRQ